MRPKVLRTNDTNLRVPTITGLFDVSLHLGPPNDTCEGAVELQESVSVPGTLSGATVEEANNAFNYHLDCDGIRALYHSVWYKFNGTDQPVSTQLRLHSHSLRKWFSCFTLRNLTLVSCRIYSRISG